MICVQYSAPLPLSNPTYIYYIYTHIFKVLYKFVILLSEQAGSTSSRLNHPALKTALHEEDVSIATPTRSVQLAHLILLPTSTPSSTLFSVVAVSGGR